MSNLNEWKYDPNVLNEIGEQQITIRTDMITRLSSDGRATNVSQSADLFRYDQSLVGQHHGTIIRERGSRLNLYNENSIFNNEPLSQSQSSHFGSNSEISTQMLFMNDDSQLVSNSNQFLNSNHQSLGSGAVPSPDIRKKQKNDNKIAQSMFGPNQVSDNIESTHLMRPPLQHMAEPHFDPKSLGQDNNLYLYKKDGENEDSSKQNGASSYQSNQSFVVLGASRVLPLSSSKGNSYINSMNILHTQNGTDTNQKDSGALTNNMGQDIESLHSSSCPNSMPNNKRENFLQ